MQRFKVINEDYMEEISQDELTQEPTSDESVDFFSSQYDVTAGILWDTSFLNMNPEFYQKVADRIESLLDKFLSDSYYATPIVIMNNQTHDNSMHYESTEGFTQIQDVPTVNKYYQQITIDYPCIFIIFSLKVPEKSPLTTLRLISSILNIASTSMANDTFFTRNDNLDYYTEAFTSYGVDVFLRKYFTWNDEDRTLSTIANTFMHVFDIFREIFYPDNPYKAALKAIPEFSPAKCFLAQVCNFLHQFNETTLHAEQETSIIGKEIDDRHQIHGVYDFEFSFSASLSDAVRVGGCSPEMKRYLTKFSTDHYMDFMSKVEDGGAFVKDAYHITYPQRSYTGIPKHFLFIYLGCIYDEEKKWPYYGGLILAAQENYENLLNSIV